MDISPSEAETFWTAFCASSHAAGGAASSLSSRTPASKKAAAAKVLHATPAGNSGRGVVSDRGRALTRIAELYAKNHHTRPDGRDVAQQDERGGHHRHGSLRKWLNWRTSGYWQPLARAAQSRVLLPSHYYRTYRALGSPRVF
jgi:hypothetical protein